MNSGYYTLIIALIYLAVHVISLIAKESAKRKERERQREIAERRQGSSSPSPPPPSKAPAAINPQFGIGMPVSGSNRPATQRGPSQAEQMASLRKKQLEQLRLRREGHRTGRPIDPQLRAPSTPNNPGTRSQTTQRAPIEIATLPDDHRSDPQRQQDQARARFERQTQIARQREAAARLEAAREASRRLEESKRRESEAAETPAEAVHPATVARGPSPSPMRSQLKQRASLRELMVLKELIDPPVSLRSPTM